MWPSYVPWQDVLDLLNALGAVIFLVGGALEIARKARDLHDRKRDDEDER